MPDLIGPIVRGDDAPSLSRNDVRQGMIFAAVMHNGLGRNYAALGANGRAYSLNLATGELASTDNFEREVQITGSWQFDVDRTYRRETRIGSNVLRSEVQPGEVFVVDGKDKEYAHMGPISEALDGWLSIPLANPENHAVTSNGTSHVVIVATFRVMPTLAK